MTTLVTALVYLWIVITILLAAVWLLRRQDGRRSRDRDLEEMTVIVEAQPEPAATEKQTAARPSTIPAPPTMLDLLEGVALPYDLTPATGRIADPERHAIFLSPHADAEEVGTAFADELTRLGFGIEPDGLDRARATRDDQVLMLRISPQAGTRGSGDYRRYPTAGPDDVAIEIWTGQDSPPRLADGP